MIFCNLSRNHFIIQTSFLVFYNEYLINKFGIKRATQNMYNTEEFVLCRSRQIKCSNLVQRMPAYNVQTN